MNVDGLTHSVPLQYAVRVFLEFGHSSWHGIRTRNPDGPEVDIILEVRSRH